MPSSLIDFRDWTPTELETLLDLSFHLEKEKSSPSLRDRNAALLFFEPSTRTRMSFELACYSEGLNCTVLAGKSGTSLEKGESAEDTVLNIAAMGPDVLVIRTGNDLNLKELEQKLSQPILNAGWGVNAHPTQALLDIRTLMAQGLKTQDIRIVLVGDVKHSRVASSHFELSEKLGYKIAVCCPEAFKPNCSQKVERFESLDEALKWGNAVMMLRFQLERHQEQHAREDFLKFQLNLEKIQNWNRTMKMKGWLMHPGPVNYGVELDPDVKTYENNLILAQVNSGFWIRRACLKRVLK